MKGYALEVLLTDEEASHFCTSAVSDYISIVVIALKKMLDEQSTYGNFEEMGFSKIIPSCEGREVAVIIWVHDRASPGIHDVHSVAFLLLYVVHQIGVFLGCSCVGLQ